MQRWPPHLATSSSSSSSLTGAADGSCPAAAAALRPASAAAFAHLQPAHAQQSVSKSFNYGVVEVATAGGGGCGGANVSNGSFVPSVDAFNVSRFPQWQPGASQRTECLNSP